MAVVPNEGVDRVGDIDLDEVMAVLKAAAENIGSEKHEPGTYLTNMFLRYPGDTWDLYYTISYHASYRGVIPSNTLEKWLFSAICKALDAKKNSAAPSPDDGPTDRIASLMETFGGQAKRKKT